MFLFADCGQGDYERSRYDLAWKLASKYQVTSPYIAVKGELCVGLLKDSLVEIVYRDNTGVFVKTTLDEAKNKDVILIKHSDFPRSAQIVSRKTDPLSLTIKELGNSNYLVTLKFLRNINKSIYADDLRAIEVKANVNNYEMSVDHKGFSFDLIKLSLTSGLKVNFLEYFKDERIVLEESSLDLASTTRKN